MNLPYIKHIITLIAVAGWLTAAILIAFVGDFKLRTMSAEGNAATWKQQAGKAYTELLKAKAGASSTTAIIPAGARINCTATVVDEHAISKCEDGIIYPPLDY